MLTLTSPELTVRVEFADDNAKATFAAVVNEALLESHPFPSRWQLPPLRRKAAFHFSDRHPVFAGARYDGLWLAGLPHGRSPHPSSSIVL